MTDDEFIFDLQDRIVKIKSINEQYDLVHNSYIAFSGGKDSTILHYLIDVALPGNNIPRVFANTGIEYIETVNFVKKLAINDSRFIILNQTRNIKKTLDIYGYPFKSKEHCDRLFNFNRGSTANYVKRYLDFGKSFCCPKILSYQFTEKGKYNYSKQCCYKLKKELSHKWQLQNKKSIVITGMRIDESGSRKFITCINSFGTKFHPLAVVSSVWENKFIDYYNIELNKLYYSPYNFKRTGCKGCPFNSNLQNDLEILYKLLPKEYYQCLFLWKPVYDEYIRIGYRLKYYPHEVGIQYNIFDFI